MLHLRYADPVYVPTGAASAVAISRDRRYVAVGYNQSPFLSVYPLHHDQMSLGDRIDAPALATPPSQGPRDVEWSPDGRFLFASWAVAPYLVGLEFDPDAGVFTGANSVPSWSLQSYSITFHPTAPYVAMTISGSNGIRLYEYDPDTGTIITSGAQTKPQSGGLYCAWSPNGRLLAASHSLAAPYLSVYPFDPDTGVLSDRLNWSSGSIPTNTANAGLDFNTTGERLITLNYSDRELTFFEINPTYGGYIARRQFPITDNVIPNLPTGTVVHSVTCPDEFHAVIGTSGTLDANIGLHGFTDYLVDHPNIWAQRRTPIPSVAPVGRANRVTKMGNLVAAAMQTPPYIMVYTWQPMGVRITGENEVVYVGSDGLIKRLLEMPYVVRGNHGPAIPLTLKNTTDAILESVEVDYTQRQTPTLTWRLDASLSNDPFEPVEWPLVLEGPFAPNDTIGTVWLRARADEDAVLATVRPTLTVNAMEVEP